MSSQLKIDANRRNALRSTGPRSPAGKAKVAHNGRPHGLSSRNPVLPIENPAELQALLDRLRATFQPANEAQEFSLREMAWADWRLRRVARIESGLYAYRLERAREVENCPDTAPQPARTIRQQRYDQETRLLGIAFYRDCEDNAFVKLSRYENALRRAYYKARNELPPPQSPREETPPMQSQIPPRDPTPPPPAFNIEDTYAEASPEPPPFWPVAAQDQNLLDQTQIPPPDLKPEVTHPQQTAEPPTPQQLAPPTPQRPRHRCTPVRQTRPAAAWRRRPTHEMPVDTRRAKADIRRRTWLYAEDGDRAQRSRHGHIVRRPRRECGLEWEAYGTSRDSTGFLEGHPAGHRPGGRRHARRRTGFQTRARGG